MRFLQNIISFLWKYLPGDRTGVYLTQFRDFFIILGPPAGFQCFYEFFFASVTVTTAMTEFLTSLPVTKYFTLLRDYVLRSELNVILVQLSLEKKSPLQNLVISGYYCCTCIMYPSSCTPSYFWILKQKSLYKIVFCKLTLFLRVDSS